MRGWGTATLEKLSSSSFFAISMAKAKATTAAAGAKRKRTASPPSTAKKSAKQASTSTSTSTSPISSAGGLRCPPIKSLKEFVRSDAAVQSLNEKRPEDSIWSSVVPFKRWSKAEDFKPASMYKFITWNVAGLRGILRKDDKVLLRFMAKEQPDILCLQETKLNPAETKENALLGAVPNYCFFDHISYTKKGYSGTRVYLHQSRVAKEMQALTTRGFSLPEHVVQQKKCQSEPKETGNEAEEIREFESARCGSDKVYWPADVEGRVQTVWLHPGGSASSASAASRSRSPSPSSATPPFSLALINTYIPNSGMTLDRLPYRVEHFDPAMRSYLKDVQTYCQHQQQQSQRKRASGSPRLPSGIIWTGDLNVAARDFDRYYAGTWRKMQECSGFTPEERFSFRDTLLALGGAGDAFRELYPHAAPTYTFWSARIKGREKGLGWRLDYFILSKDLLPFVVEVFPMPEQEASDHCPVQMWIKKQLKA